MFFDCFFGLWAILEVIKMSRECTAWKKQWLPQRMACMSEGSSQTINKTLFFLKGSRQGMSGLVETKVGMTGGLSACLAQKRPTEVGLTKKRGSQILQRGFWMVKSGDHERLCSFLHEKCHF